MFLFTKEEKDIIHQKIYLLKTKNTETYLRNMIIDGYIVNTNM